MLRACRGAGCDVQTHRRVRRTSCVLACVALVASAHAPADIRSLEDLSIETLRARGYSSRLQIVEPLGPPRDDAKRGQPCGSDAGAHRASLIAEYQSDGSLVYARIDVPASPMPPEGYPVVIFLHGWYSNDDAPDFDFSNCPGTPYADVIDAYAKAGFVVAYPGWRGYGTVQGRPADGIEFLKTWGNASYLSPIFSAVDVLNLLDGMQTLDEVEWKRWRVEPAVRVDLGSIHLAAHSQGGDVALTALAVAGEGSRVRNPIASASIWAGCFASRFRQLETYGPMDSTLQAFFSGDGTWNSTARGANGLVNADFVFGWPPDWIETVDRKSPAWTWQAEHWSLPSVEAALRRKYAEMYETLNRHVADLGDARFDVSRDATGRTVVTHDQRVEQGMARIGGFGYPQYLREPLILHVSDQDYYSIPAWNEDLVRRIEKAGGQGAVFVYPGNTHGLRKSEHQWFSAAGVVPGFDYMLRRDVALFRAKDPRQVVYP